MSEQFIRIANFFAFHAALIVAELAFAWWAFPQGPLGFFVATGALAGTVWHATRVPKQFDRFFES